MNHLPRLLAFVLACAVLLVPSALRAADNGATLDAANRDYAGGNYEEAARLFQQIIDAQGYSAPICFNLANAEARAGHVGLAILNYERARYLAPGDADIDHNLQLARKQAGLETDSYRWWQIVLRNLSINQWITIVDGCLALIALAVLVNAFSAGLAPRLGLSVPALKKFVKGVLFVSIPCFLFFGYVALIAAPLRIEGVILTKDTTLRLSPFDSAERIGSLPEGDLVTVEESHDDYVRVAGRNNVFGWVEKKSVAPVIDGSF
jgi:tetratricopeptide (TPR) repeat protein